VRTCETVPAANKSGRYSGVSMPQQRRMIGERSSRSACDDVTERPSLRLLRLLSDAPRVASRRIIEDDGMQLWGGPAL
jgi:hypothetical protein